MLTKKKMTYFKKRLEDERSRILTALNLNEDVKEIREPDRDLNDEGDQAVDLSNQTYTWAMRKRELVKLREIDAALLRIEDGTFGVCEETGDPIDERRLEVQPWARVSLEVAREMEENRRQRQASHGNLSNELEAYGY